MLLLTIINLQAKALKLKEKPSIPLDFLSSKKHSNG